MFIDLTKNQIYESGSPKICCSCEKQFRPGDIVTINETYDIVHLKCKEDNDRKKMAERLKAMTKDELIEKLRRVIRNDDNNNDYAIVRDIDEIIGRDPKMESDI